MVATVRGPLLRWRVGLETGWSHAEKAARPSKSDPWSVFFKASSMETPCSMPARSTLPRTPRFSARFPVSRQRIGSIVSCMGFARWVNPGMVRSCFSRNSRNRKPITAPAIPARQLLDPPRLIRSRPGMATFQRRIGMRCGSIMEASRVKSEG